MGDFHCFVFCAQLSRCIIYQCLYTFSSSPFLYELISEIKVEMPKIIWKAADSTPLLIPWKGLINFLLGYLLERDKWTVPDNNTKQHGNNWPWKKYTAKQQQQDVNQLHFKWQLHSKLCNIYYAVALPYGKTESDACYNIQEKKHKEKRAIWELKDFCNLRKKVQEWNIWVYFV